MSNESPPSVVPGPTIGQLSDVRRMRESQDDVDTLTSCPWCQLGMVHPDKAAEWRAAYPELSQETE